MAVHSHHQNLSNKDNAGDGDGDDFTDIYFTSTDGLTLYARDYGTQHTDVSPVVCLHGFTGNSQDFHDLARHMAQQRRVIIPDLRGRGRSDYARDKNTYTAPQEMQDVLDLMVVTDIQQAVILGTSRGGLIAMLMAALRPTVIKAVILNDIGPVIEHKGLLRISGQMNNMPKPVGWTDASEIIAQAHALSLPGSSDDEWMALARRRFKRSEDGIVPDYDPALAQTFSREVSKAQTNKPDLWSLFSALTVFPCLLIRGELSEILSSETAEEMRKRHDNLEIITVKNRGHAPQLNEPGVVKAIDKLIAKAQRA